MCHETSMYRIKFIQYMDYLHWDDSKGPRDDSKGQRDDSQGPLSTAKMHVYICTRYIYTFIHLNIHLYDLV